jgi:hypothetical protein
MILTGAGTVGTSFAQTIASCSSPEGYAYYHHTDLVPKEKSGFEKDKITGGLTSLQQLSKGELDVLYVDTRKTIISSKQDGARIALLRRGSSDVTVLVWSPNASIELYTFYRDSAGNARFDILSSKGGDAMPIHKSAVMTGLCSELNLELLK